MTGRAKPIQRDLMTNSTEKHQQLIAAGWRSRVDGRWISPHPDDARFAFTFTAAWAEHTRREHGGNDAD
jgi:hypothetical protein